MFNRTLLARIDRELGADCRLERFRHSAVYNQKKGRIEMSLVSEATQTVHIGEAAIEFGKGESILTECSYKYTVGEFTRLAASAGLRAARTWMDAERLFSVHYLTC